MICLRPSQEKIKLDADLKTAEMRMLTLFEELLLLKDFEKTDKALSNKKEKARAEGQHRLKSQVGEIDLKEAGD